MFVKLGIDEIFCQRPASNSGVWPFIDDRDEVYFTIAGSTSRRHVNPKEVRPSGDEDYYGLSKGGRKRDVLLWEGNIAEGEFAYVTIVVREQVNKQLGAIADAVKAAALTLGAIFFDPSLGPAALDSLKDASLKLVNSLSADGDLNLAAFAVRMHVINHSLVTDWLDLPNVSTVFINREPRQATCEGRGNGSFYTIRLETEVIRLPMIVSCFSGKCLDVENGSVNDQANVQQYTNHGGDNQRWLLKPIWPLVDIAIPVAYAFHPVFMILNGHSGKCLDVENASLQDQANVQQYEPHYGLNQQWIMVPRGSAGEFVLVCRKSRKVLDVKGLSRADNANIHQYAYNDGLNQRWRLQY